MRRKDVFLFISRESATYNYTRRQVELACKDVFGKRGDPELRIIDIEDEPELAEKHNIEALPTVIVGDKRIVGTATREMLMSCMGYTPPHDGV